jgi:hypothetical protein
MSGELCQNEIRDLAYAKWEQAGCPEGNGVDFWLEAEKELIACGKKTSGVETSCCDQPLKISEPATTAFKKAS